MLLLVNTHCEAVSKGHYISSCRLLRHDLTADISAASLSFREAGGIRSLRKAAGAFAARQAGAELRVLMYRNVHIEDVLVTLKAGACFQVTVPCMHTLPCW